MEVELTAVITVIRLTSKAKIIGMKLVLTRD